MIQAYCTYADKKPQITCCHRCFNQSAVVSRTKMSSLSKKKKTNFNVYLKEKNHFSNKLPNRRTESTTSETLASNEVPSSWYERMRKHHKLLPKSQESYQEKITKNYCDCNKCRKVNNIVNKKCFQKYYKNDGYCCKCCPYQSNNSFKTLQQENSANKVPPKFRNTTSNDKYQNQKNPLLSKFGYYLNPEKCANYYTKYPDSYIKYNKEKCKQLNSIWASIKERASFADSDLNLNPINTGICKYSTLDKAYYNENPYKVVQSNNNYNKFCNNLKVKKDGNIRRPSSDYGKCRVCSKSTKSYSDLQNPSSSNSSIVRQLWINRRPIELKESLTYIDSCDVQHNNNNSNNINSDNSPQYQISKHSLKDDFPNYNQSFPLQNDYCESIDSFSSTTNVNKCCCCNQISDNKNRLKQLKQGKCNFPLSIKQKNQTEQNIYKLALESDKIELKKMCCPPLANQGNRYMHDSSELVMPKYQNINYFTPTFKKQCTTYNDIESKHNNFSGNNVSFHKCKNRLSIPPEKRQSKIHYSYLQLNSELKQLQTKSDESYKMGNDNTLFKNGSSNVSDISLHNSISEIMIRNNNSNHEYNSETNKYIIDKGYDGDTETDTPIYQKTIDKQTMIFKRRKKIKLYRSNKFAKTRNQKNNLHNQNLVKLCHKYSQPLQRTSGGDEQKFSTHKAVVRSSRPKLATITCSKCSTQNNCLKKHKCQHRKISRMRSKSLENRNKLLEKQITSNNNLLAQKLSCYKEECKIVDKYKFCPSYSRVLSPISHNLIPIKMPQHVDWLKSASMTQSRTKSSLELSKVNSGYKNQSASIKNLISNKKNDTQIVETDKNQENYMKKEQVKRNIDEQSNKQINSTIVKEIRNRYLKNLKVKEEFDNREKIRKLKETLNKIKQSKCDKIKIKVKETAMLKPTNNKIIEAARNVQVEPRLKQDTPQLFPINERQSLKQRKTLHHIKRKSSLQAKRSSSSQQKRIRISNIRSPSKYNQVEDTSNNAGNHNIKFLNESKSNATEMCDKSNQDEKKINRPHIFVAKKNFQEHLKNIEQLKGLCSTHNCYLPTPELVNLHQNQSICKL